MQLLLSMRQLHWGQSICGVCAEVTGPHTKERQGLAYSILETLRRKFQFGDHTDPICSGRGQSPILSCPPAETCPNSPSYLMPRVSTAPPITTRQRAIFQEERRGEERNWKRVGRQSSAPDPALVPAQRSTHLAAGTCQPPHRCPRSHRFHERRIRLGELEGVSKGLLFL